MDFKFLPRRAFQIPFSMFPEALGSTFQTREMNKSVAKGKCHEKARQAYRETQKCLFVFLLFIFLGRRALHPPTGESASSSLSPTPTSSQGAK